MNVKNWKPPPNWKQNLALNIKLVRTDLNISQMDLSLKFGFISNAVAKWEKTGSVQMDDFFRLCDILNRSPQEMLGNEISVGSRASPTESPPPKEDVTKRLEELEATVKELMLRQGN
jgi:transcriptional regulator with XRE-family HTH domain